MVRAKRGQQVPPPPTGKEWEYDSHIVWLTNASAGHPKATASKNKRAPRNR